MTTLQKTILGAVLVLAFGSGLYEAQLLHRQQGELEARNRQAEPVRQQLTRLRQQRNETDRQIAAAQRQTAGLKTEIAEAAAGIDPETEAEMRAWQGRVDRLKQTLEENPQWKIPELQLLTDTHWFTEAQNLSVDSPESVRKTLAALRTTAVRIFGGQITTALRAYAADHAGTPPGNILQLASYFRAPVDPSILSRYQVLPPEETNGSAAAPFGPYLIFGKAIADLENDSIIRIGLRSSSSGSALEYYAGKARKAFIQANNGQNPTEPAQLLPYLPQAVDPAKLQPYVKSQ